MITATEPIDEQNRGGRSSGVKQAPENTVGIQAKLNVLRRTARTLISGIDDLESHKFLLRPPTVERGIDFYEEVSRFERVLITRALKHTNGSQKHAAERLNMKLSTLNSKIKTLNISCRNYMIDTNRPAR